MILTWFGHATFKIESGEKIIYIDPILDPFQTYALADLILISHWDFNHATIESVEKIRKPETLIFGTKEVAREIFGCKALTINQEVSIDGIKILALPARENPLARKKRWIRHEPGLGFLMQLENKNLYYVGDTELIPEIEKVIADILFIPIGASVMGVEEAAQLAKKIYPKIAIPYHWGKIEGSLEDAEYFKDLVENEEIKVLILKINEPIEL